MSNQEWDIRIPASVVHKGIPHGAMLLYGKLRQMSGSKGHCWPFSGLSCQVAGLLRLQHQEMVESAGCGTAY